MVGAVVLDADQAAALGRVLDYMTAKKVEQSALAATWNAEDDEEEFDLDQSAEDARREARGCLAAVTDADLDALAAALERGK